MQEYTIIANNVIGQFELTNINKKCLLQVLITKMISYEHKFNPNKGKFNTYFSTIAKNIVIAFLSHRRKNVEHEMIKQYKEECIKHRNSIINEILESV